MKPYPNTVRSAARAGSPATQTPLRLQLDPNRPAEPYLHGAWWPAQPSRRGRLSRSYLPNTLSPAAAKDSAMSIGKKIARTAQAARGPLVHWTRCPSTTGTSQRSQPAAMPYPCKDPIWQPVLAL